MLRNTWGSIETTYYDNVEAGIRRFPSPAGSTSRAGGKHFLEDLAFSSMASLSRTENLDRLRAGETWDILIIGGGATGLGTAVDAAARGYRTLLLEARDFAQGTSSRSTKLIHGGVRYLAQGNIPLVREALHERALLLENAPHLVRAREFLVPALRYWELPYYAAGLWLYDRLAGRLNLGRSSWVSRTNIIARVPTIRPPASRRGRRLSCAQPR